MKQTKICTKCKKEKTLEEFRLNPRCRFGRNSICRTCDIEHEKTRGQSAYYRQWYLKNKEKRRASQKVWDEAHKLEMVEKRKLQQQKKLEAHKCSCGVSLTSLLYDYCKDCRYRKQLENSRNYYNKNKDKAAQRHRRYYEENKERIKRYNAEWQRRNPDKIRATQERYRKKKKD